jgi:8-oxo-dGTP pyrophosphatase MutT (NUDIX family)
VLGVRRAAYRVAYRLLWMLALVRPPHGQGVKAALVCRGEILLVRHTYGPDRWELPGGGVRRGEEPFAGLQRELSEELGIEIGAASLIGTLTGGGRLRHHHTHLYRVDLDDPRIRPDPVEIAEVRWCDPAAPPRPNGSFVRRVLVDLQTSAPSTRPSEVDR